MCGRYAASRSPEDLAEEFEVDRIDPTARERLVPDWNVAPTKDVPAVLVRHRRDEEGRRTHELERRLTAVRWGLVPSWAKDPTIGSRLINARMETVDSKPAFRRAFASRRCLLPADGYFEWYAATGRGKRKQPFFVHPRDGGVLAMAGLYELWRDPSGPEGAGGLLWTCTVLTTQAEDALGQIHDRMPLLVEPERWVQWLDPTWGRADEASEDGPSADELRRLLVPAAPGRLDAEPVSTEVNDVRNNGPQLVQPLPPEEASALGVPSDAVAGRGTGPDSSAPQRALF